MIEHDRGLVLFDTGQDRRSVTDANYFPRGIPGLIFRRLARFKITENETLVAGLRRLGHSADDVTTVVLSHLHQDHMGGLRDLPNARILISGAELDRSRAPLAAFEGYLVDHLSAPEFDWRPVVFDDSSSVPPFTRAHDVFGDGALLIVETPGHTAGSVSMVVSRGALPPLILVGDLTYDIDVFEAGGIPGIGPSAVVRRSADKVREFARNTGAIVLAAHDPAASDLLEASMGAGS